MFRIPWFSNRPAMLMLFSLGAQSESTATFNVCLKTQLETFALKSRYTENLYCIALSQTRKMDSEAIVRERDYIFSKLYYFYDKHDKSKLDFASPQKVMDMSKRVTLVLNEGFDSLNEKLETQHGLTISEEEYHWPIKHDVFHQRNRYYVILTNYSKKNRVGLDPMSDEFEEYVTYALDKGVAALNSKLVSKYKARLDI